MFSLKEASNKDERLKMEMMVASMGESPKKSTQRVWRENGFLEIRELILQLKKPILVKTLWCILIMAVLPG